MSQFNPLVSNNCPPRNIQQSLLLKGLATLAHPPVWNHVARMIKHFVIYVSDDIGNDIPFLQGLGQHSKYQIIPTISCVKK